MKKIIFSIATSLFIMNAIAQPGCFIHKVYEPLVVELRMFTPFYFDITGDTRNLETGLYVYKVVSGSREIACGKFVKE